MSNLYLLLYLPLAGLTVLWLFAALKLAKDYRQHSRETLLRILGAEVAVGLFIVSFAVMVVTHARGYKVAMILVMVMALVNFFRMRVPNGLVRRRWAVLTPAEDTRHEPEG